MKIGFAQINPTVGDIRENQAQILAAYRSLVTRGAEIVLTPELALTGYPPQDLLFQSGFVDWNLACLQDLAASTEGPPLVTGFVEKNPGVGKPFLNSAAVLQNGRIVARRSKSLLPTYDVFDEDRYFEPARDNTPVEILGKRLGITLCEDIWTETFLPRALYGKSPLGALSAAGADLVLNLSASPFTLGKPALRARMLGEVAGKQRVPIAYCNSVGANDQLVFDGNSLLFSGDGTLLRQGASFEPWLEVVDLDASPRSEGALCDEAALHSALVLGVRDYVHKCGFRSVVLGLSGGIDSAVVACVAAAALGPENVLGVTMPTEFSSPGSVKDSEKLARALGIRFLNVPIQASLEAFRSQFVGLFAGLAGNETEENMQPRLRGMTLMALSNKFGHLVLSTGNKSELAVGYCTLYGDMCGGLAVISDVPKMMIYRLARWINRDSETIPRSTLEKAPSAELKPDQKDQDTLPPYEILDPILECFVEEQLSAEEIIARGFDPQTVHWVIQRVIRNEYKRAQAAPGLKVTSRAFGVGRKMPVAHRYSGLHA
jgi:NAD+ synthase (glutamine-hydrolysing)